MINAKCESWHRLVGTAELLDCRVCYNIHTQACFFRACVLEKQIPKQVEFGRRYATLFECGLCPALMNGLKRSNVAVLSIRGPWKDNATLFCLKELYFGSPLSSITAAKDAFLTKEMHKIVDNFQISCHSDVMLAGVACCRPALKTFLSVCLLCGSIQVMRSSVTIEASLQSPSQASWWWPRLVAANCTRFSDVLWKFLESG